MAEAHLRATGPFIFLFGAISRLAWKPHGFSTRERQFRTTVKNIGKERRQDRGVQKDPDCGFCSVCTPGLTYPAPTSSIKYNLSIYQTIIANNHEK